MPNRFENPAIYLQSGDPEKENTPTLHAPGLLGSRFTVIQPTGRGSPPKAGAAKRYQLVKTDSTMTTGPYPGAVAYWVDKTQYLVTTANTNLSAIAGKFSNLVDKGNYTCVQFGGPGYVKLLDADVASAAVGDYVLGSGTVGKATRAAAGGTYPVTQVMGRVGVPLTKSASEALVMIDLDIPETL